MIYSEAERKEIERVYGVFKDYIHASKFLDFVWSEKLGYLLLHIDPNKKHHRGGPKSLLLRMNCVPNYSTKLQRMFF